MKTGTNANWTNTGIAAIDDLERKPFSRVVIDWEAGSENESDNVVGLQGRIGYEEEAITGFVPSGAISGDVDIELKSGSKYSAFNTSSALYESARLHRDVDIYTGFVTATGSEYLQQHDGYTDSIEVRSADRQTTIHSVDKADLLKRKTITWPIMKDVPSDYVIRAALAEVDISDGQINDNQTDFMCKFDGTLTSEQGHTPWYWDLSPPTFATGYFGSSCYSVFSLRYQNDINSKYFKRGFIAFRGSFGSRSLSVTILGKSNYDYYKVDVNKGGVNFIYNTSDPFSGGYFVGDVGSHLLNTGSWNHVVALWDSDTNITQIFVNGTEAGRSDLGTCNLAKTRDSNQIEVGYEFPGSAWIDHLSIGPYFRTPKDIENMATADTADDDETDIDEGKNTLDWLYVKEKNAWELIRDICQAEGASFYFDSQGKAHFENRYHLFEPPHDSSQKTISYDADTVNISTNESIEQRANKVIVRGHPLSKQDGTIIASMADEFRVKANSTREFWLDFDDPAVGAVTTFTASAGDATGSSCYSCWRKRWGSYGTNMTGYVTLHGTAFAESMKIIASNVHPTWNAWLVGSDGTPHVTVWGSLVKTTESEDGMPPIYFVSEDTDDIAAYGERSIEIDNPYMTNSEYAGNMADYMLHYYSDPKPKVEGVQIMGDPRLEPGDRITLQDDSGATGLDDDFWVMGIDWTIDPMYTQNLNLSYADTSDWLVYNIGTYNVHRYAW